MPLTIPLPTGIPHFALSVELDRETFKLSFRWNARAAAWFMAIDTPEGSPIQGSKRLAVDFPLNVRSRDARRPAGNLVAVDTSDKQLEAGLEDLGGRVQLLYYVAGEL